MACQEERAEIAVILVENGANLHIQNKVGDSNHESNRYLSISHCHISGLYSKLQSTPLLSERIKKRIAMSSVIRESTWSGGD